jgi:hypothetical protein
MTAHLVIRDDAYSAPVELDLSPDDLTAIFDRLDADPTTLTLSIRLAHFLDNAGVDISTPNFTDTRRANP